MVEIIRWKREENRVDKPPTQAVGIVSIDWRGAAIKISSGPEGGTTISQTTHIRGARLRELRDIINQALGE